MNGTKPYAVFFDLDKTLTGTNSGYALVRTAYNKGLLRKRDLIRPFLMLLLYKAGLQPADTIITTLGKRLKGMDNADFDKLAEQAVTDYLLASIFPEAREELAFHKKANGLTVILSSAVDGICNPVAGHLSIEKVICTMMECEDGKLTGVPSGNYCYGEEKSWRLKEFCRENGYNTENAFYYADSFSDAEALKIVGNPVCINPDRRLRKHAKKNGWPVRRWNVKF